MAQKITTLKTSTKLVDFSTINQGEFFEYNSEVYGKLSDIICSGNTYNCFKINPFGFLKLNDTDKVQKYTNADIKVYD